MLQVGLSDSHFHFLQDWDPKILLVPSGQVLITGVASYADGIARTFTGAQRLEDIQRLKLRLTGRAIRKTYFSLMVEIAE